MAEKVDPNFKHSLFKFFHKPIRDADKKADGFLEDFLFGFQRQFEDYFTKTDELINLLNPEKTTQPRFLKDIVGFTKELDNITKDITDDELRRIITLAIPLFRSKGKEIAYRDIIKIFTGKNTRIFNWFDFRYIAGVEATGEEQLDERSWFISTPGVTASEPSGNVVLLLTFEGNTRDRSVYFNDAIDHAGVEYFNTGPVQGSTKYVKFDGGLHVPVGSPSPCPGDILEISPHTAYDFSSDLTIEFFIRTSIDHDSVVLKHTDGSKEISISYKTLTNEISYVLDDGSTIVGETLSASADLDDNTFRHVTLILDRTNDKARLYLDGTEATAGVSLGGLLDLTMASSSLFLGGAGFGTSLFAGDMDNFRMSLSAQYDLTTGSLTVPSFTFVEAQEEVLDEFRTDIRVVDSGDLNRVLTKRILNLMRPVGERLNVIYIRFFEDFLTGKGDLVSKTLGAGISGGDLLMPDGSEEQSDAIGSGDYQDIYLQVRSKFSVTGIFSIKFLIQDDDNYYVFVIDSAAQTVEIKKVVATVPTSLVGPTSLETVNETYYIWSISTDFNDVESKTTIKCYQNSNLVAEAEDSSFEKGTWSISSGAGAASSVSDIEMFLKPLDVDVVGPGFNL